MSAPGMVIIGAGEAGVRAAFSLRERGYARSITLIGEEPHTPYERPPLSKASAEEGALRPIFQHEQFEDVGIDLQRGLRVEAIDCAQQAVLLRDGRRIDYDRLLLATGATPRLLSDVPASPCVRALRTLDDFAHIRFHLAAKRHLAIIGGGFIGLELAAQYVSQGINVTLIEAQPRILMRGVPEPLAGTLHRRHVAEGVDLICGIGIQNVEASNEKVVIRLKNGVEVAADMLVIGIGAQPNTKLAEEAGLAISNGIAVNDRLTTSDPNIFAAGDCCSFPAPLYDGRRVRLESWRNAQEQGAAAAANMMGANAPFTAVPWFWSDQYDLTLQVAGLSDGAEVTATRSLSEDTQIIFHLTGDGRLLAASGLGPGGAIARDIRLAEMLIARKTTLDPEKLSDPAFKLKTLL